MAKVRRIRADEGAMLRAIRLRALRESQSAFSSTLERELAYGDELWATRASDASAGVMAATFVADTGEPNWLGLVTVLGVGHEATSGRDAAELVSMWIAPDARLQGLGKALVQASLDYALQSKAAAVELSVLRDNGDAVRFYQGLGFVQCSATSLPAEHACIDELRMRIALRPAT